MSGLKKKIWQVHVSGYLLVEAEFPDDAERAVMLRLDDEECRLNYEASDDVTESPRFAGRIAAGDVLR